MVVLVVAHKTLEEEVTLKRIFKPLYQTPYKNLLASGCSMTFNNSQEHMCSWPYYLRDLGGFETVYNVAQSGAGTSHIFNSIVNEVENNPQVNPEHTQIIVMWSGLTRTDTITTKDITAPWHHMSNYHFNERFATLSLWNRPTGDTLIDELCRNYKLLVDVDATIYESMLKIIALKGYLENKGFNSVFTNMMDPAEELKRINKTINELDDIPYLLEFATEQKMLESNDGHPTPDGYLRWTKEHLIPYLVK